MKISVSEYLPNISFNNFVKDDCIYLTVYKPCLKGIEFKLSEYFPCLALLGYYNYPDGSNNSLKYIISSSQEAISQVVNVRYLNQRHERNIRLKRLNGLFEKSNVIKVIYEKLLVNTDNQVYRFIILYQIIEELVEIQYEKGIGELIDKREGLSKAKFLEKINELANTRKVIKHFFSQLHFDGKEEITSIIKDFILQFDQEYSKTETGDCFYDVRNLLVHDFKTVIEKGDESNLTGLLIQYEILIHQLVLVQNWE